MSQTPRTDELAKGYRGLNFREDAWYDLSSDLEMENAELKAQLDEISKHVKFTAKIESETGKLLTGVSVIGRTEV